MARKPRVEFPGALYHVLSRGNNRRPIFRDPKDYNQLLDLLAKYRKRQTFRLFAFVLMTNHFHLLLEAGPVPLSTTMQQVLGSYTRYFNRRHHRMGHLFQARYKAILCEKESYLLELVRYIHLNPVRSKMVEGPSAYPWSSHRTYLGKENRDFVDAAPILRIMSRGVAQARKLYSDFVLDGLSQGHRKKYYPTREQRFLGSEEFVEEVKSQVNEEKEDKPKKNINPKSILMAVSNRLGVSAERILGDSQGTEVSLSRGVVAYLAKREGGQSGKQVADFLNRDPSVIVRMVEKVESKIQEDNNFRQSVATLARYLAKRG